jgi:Icc protein
MPVHLPAVSRRQFLKATAAVSAGIVLPQSLWARGDADPDRWILLSDLHIPGDRDQKPQGIKPADNFEKARENYLKSANNACGLIVSGDLAVNAGKPEDYALLRELLGPIREAGIPAHMAFGNHDDRENFFNAFADDRPSVPPPVANKHVSIIESRNANWFLLDSLVKTLYTPGRIGDEQRKWLADSLDARADRPALIVAHHNPSGPDEKTALEDTKQLFEVLLPRKHVKAFFFGHTHRWETKQVEGLHLVNLPTLVWVFNNTSTQAWCDARLSDKGVRLELHALDTKHPLHGDVRELVWRS